MALGRQYTIEFLPVFLHNFVEIKTFKRCYDSLNQSFSVKENRVAMRNAISEMQTFPISKYEPLSTNALLEKKMFIDLDNPFISRLIAQLLLCLDHNDRAASKSIEFVKDHFESMNDAKVAFMHLKIKMSHLFTIDPAKSSHFGMFTTDSFHQIYNLQIRKFTVSSSTTEVEE